MNDAWINTDYMSIIDNGEFTSIFNEHGYCFDYPNNANFTTEQVTELISIANDVFRKAFKCGKGAKTYEVRQALGLI